METSRALLYLCLVLAGVLAEDDVRPEESVHHRHIVRHHHHLKKKHHHHFKGVRVPYKVKLLKKVPVPLKVYVKEPYYVYVKKPYVRTVVKRVPVPVKVFVRKPYPVYVEKKVPYPVRVPVIKKVPYPVKEYVRVPVKVPVHFDSEENHEEDEFGGHDYSKGNQNGGHHSSNRYRGTKYGDFHHGSKSKDQQGFGTEPSEEFDVDASAEIQNVEVADLPSKDVFQGVPKFGSKLQPDHPGPDSGEEVGYLRNHNLSH